MTVLEFESWVSDNYEELVKLARHTVGEQDGQDALHRLIENMCDGTEQLPPMEIDRLQVGFFHRCLLRDRFNLTEVEINRGLAAGLFKDSFQALGADVFVDTSLGSGRPGDELPSEMGRAIRARKERERRAGEAAYSLPDAASRVFGWQNSSTRWRYQQLRDGRLFDERAVRSLAESMHRASQRYRHDGEHGISHTEFGQEVAR